MQSQTDESELQAQCHQPQHYPSSTAHVTAILGCTQSDQCQVIDIFENVIPAKLVQPQKHEIQNQDKKYSRHWMQQEEGTSNCSPLAYTPESIK